MKRRTYLRNVIAWSINDAVSNGYLTLYDKGPIYEERWRDWIIRYRFQSSMRGHEAYFEIVVNPHSEGVGWKARKYKNCGVCDMFVSGYLERQYVKIAYAATREMRKDFSFATDIVPNGYDVRV
jgi:hypothetical protein